LKTIGHSLKILGPSQKTLRHPWSPPGYRSAGNTSLEKQILCQQIARKNVHFRNWYATCKIGISL